MRFRGLALMLGLVACPVLFVHSALTGETNPPTSAPPGRRVPLADGALFVPAGLDLGSNEVDVTLHLHGAAGVAERNFARANSPGVLVTVVLPGLSAVYAERFRDTNTLDRLLGEVVGALRPSDASPPLQVRRLTVASFSAGYGGVRELLRQPAAFARIDTLVLADSLYAGFEGDPSARKVQPEHVAGFVQFAREAVAGRKRFVLTHSQLATPNYASTVETADSLLAQLGGRRQAADETWPGGLRLVSRYRQGQFELLGFAGDTGADHLRHLHQLAAFLERAAALESADQARRP